MTHTKKLIFALGFLASVAVACGDSEGGSSSSSGSSSSGSSASCCLNGSFYSCPSSDDAQACFDNFSPGSCNSDSGRDSECSSSNSFEDEYGLEVQEDGVDDTAADRAADDLFEEVGEEELF